MYTTIAILKKQLTGVRGIHIETIHGIDQDNSEKPNFIDVRGAEFSNVAPAIALGGTYHEELYGHVVTFLNE